MNENMKEAQDRILALGFDKKVLADLEKQIKNGEERISLRESREQNAQVVDLELHLRKAGDRIYFNTFRATLNESLPTKAKDEMYLVIPKGKKDNALKFYSPYAAVAYFKKLPEDAELKMGYTAKESIPLVRREDGKIVMDNEDFRKTYRVDPVDHTVWLDRGPGKEMFKVDEAVNLVSGRAVYKENMYSMKNRTEYSAWMSLNTSEPRSGANFNFNSYGENYWKMEETLKDYQLKELEDPEKTKALETSLKAGNQPLVTTTDRDGHEIKVRIEANPQYKSFNFNSEEGKRISHADYLKPDALKLYEEKRQNRQYGEEQGMKLTA